MDLTYQTPDKCFTVTFSGDTKVVVQQLAEFNEIFAADLRCGLCKSPNVGFSYRVVDGNDYYERQCNACTARMSYGVVKATKKLFPKRKLDRHGKPDIKNGTFGEHRGWTKYRGLQSDEE